MNPGGVRNQRFSGRSVAAWVILVTLILWWGACHQIDAEAEVSGDTLAVRIAAADSSGFFFAPDTAWVQVRRNGTVYDTLTYTGDFTAITGSGEYQATYVIPSTWSGAWSLDLVGQYTGNSHTADLLIYPGPLRINPHIPTVGNVTLTATTTDVTNDVTTSGGTIDNVTLVATTTDVTNGVTVSSGTVTDVTNPVAVSSGTVDNVTLVDTVTELTEAFPTTIDSVRAVGTAYLLDEAFPTVTDSVRAVGTAYLLDEEITVSQIDSVRAVGTAYLLDEEITASVAAVDSLTPSALGDLWAGIATGGAAIIDTFDCTNCGVETAGGAKVTGAPVYITRSSTFTAMSDVVGFTWSVSGDWTIRVPALPGVADTFYVWAYQQGSYSPSGAQVIVSE